MFASISCMLITGEMEEKELFAKIDNLESQFREMTHLAVGLMKNRSQLYLPKKCKPLLKPTKSHRPLQTYSNFADSGVIQGQLKAFDLPSIFL